MAHGDLTGNAKIALEKEKAKEREAAAQQMAMATAQAEASKKDDVIDLKPTEKPEVKKDGDLQVLGVQNAEKKVKFKVNTNLEQVTIGWGNHYDFEQGRTYEAPEHVYKHLEEKGLVWH